MHYTIAKKAVINIWEDSSFVSYVFIIPFIIIGH